MDGIVIELLGWAAALAVLLAFWSRDGAWLRRFAIASNVLFIAYGLLLGALPVLVLHALLLPLNCVRLEEIQQRRRPAPDLALRGAVLREMRRRERALSFEHRLSLTFRADPTVARV